ncbi:MAG: 3-phosphoserine/phosphohydroxythreonine transaminase [Gammaproteobacteria bacterium]|nr:MAG: 3-phosphoserine/phosphohydroxythreonine transaminase [Gammaproteobacteria bacterium]
MSRVFNFSAGPANLPTEVLEQAQSELLDFNGTGTSVIEMSHRSADYMKVAQAAEQDLRDLMGIGDNYKVLFLQGGATLQFSMVPLNLTRDKKQADYFSTGIWSQKAIKEAQKFCQVNITSSAEANNFCSINDKSSWNFNPEAAYVHYTPNETIGGLSFDSIPQTGDVPLVADMSSCILSEPIDVNKFGIIYAGAQKNIGPAGLTIVIIREDLIGNAVDNTPSLLDYSTQASADSMSNTPATFSWYMAGLVFKWLKDKGGVSEINKINHAKAAKLYQAIDESDFYHNPVAINNRSIMNIPWTLKDSSFDKEFLEKSVRAGLVNLKGHRSVGGMRASIYNAMPTEGINKLINFMNDFASGK